MSGRGLSTAAIAFVVVGVVSLVPGLGLFFLGPLAALILGGAVAYRAASSVEVSPGTAGVRAGVFAGLGALVGTVVVVAVTALVLGSLTDVQELVRQSEPNEVARIPYEWIAPLAGVVGAFVGLMMGVVNLVSAVVGGVVGAVIGAQRPSANQSIAR